MCATITKDVTAAITKNKYIYIYSNGSGDSIIWIIISFVPVVSTINFTIIITSLTVIDMFCFCLFDFCFVTRIRERQREYL